MPEFDGWSRHPMGLASEEAPTAGRRRPAGHCSSLAYSSQIEFQSQTFAPWRSPPGSLHLSRKHPLGLHGNHEAPHYLNDLR